MDMSRIFTEANVDVKSMNIRTSKKQGTATIDAGFIVHGRDELDKIVKKLLQPGGRNDSHCRDPALLFHTTKSQQTDSPEASCRLRALRSVYMHATPDPFLPHS